MLGLSLRKLRSLVGIPTGWWLLIVAGTVSALLVPLLLILLGAIIRLLVVSGGPAGSPTPAELFGPYLGQAWLEKWSPTRMLVLLVSTAFVVGALESLVLFAFYRAVHRAALSVTARTKTLIYKQAFRLGGVDLLGRLRSKPEELFFEQTETIRQALQARWRVAPRSMVMLLSLIVLALFCNPLLTLAALLFCAMIWVIDWMACERIDYRRRLALDRADQYDKDFREGLQQVPLAVDSGLHMPPSGPIDDAIRRYEQETYRAIAIGTFRLPLILLMIFAGVGLLISLLGWNLLRGSSQMTLSSSVVALAALFSAAFPAGRILRLRGDQTLKEADEAAAEIVAFLERGPIVTEQPGAKPLLPLSREIVLDQVSLSDPARQKLLDRVSLRIAAHSRVAIVSSDDRVPVALAGLLIRFYDPAAGAVRFDGLDLREATLDSLRSATAWISAEGGLFTASVSENIACGASQFSLLDLTDAAKTAHVYEFVQQLPQGFSTVVGDRGTPLDASQALRIALARASLHNPSVLVIQEPDKKLNEESAKHVDEAIRRITSKRTTIILPTRITTLRSVDRVYLLHDGRLRNEGTHAELLQNDELYRHLNYVRFNPFREALANHNGG